jgi:NAD(P)-dependent dehydrogenase (short-subunit alcohol dehydrogenase family)
LNKVAVVTGASRGIGRAIAERFLEEGAKVAIFARSAEHLAEVAELAPARVLTVVGDVRQAADLQRLAEGTTRRFGTIDILVPSAGALRALPIAEWTPDALSDLWAVNFLGPLETLRTFLPHLNRRAAVIFLTTFPASTSLAGWSAYNASKGALKSLASSLAVELAPRRIRVNCIAPGPTRTAFWTAVQQSGAQRLSEPVLPAPEHLGEPKDVAEMAVFLASDAASQITGQEIVVGTDQTCR